MDLKDINSITEDIYGGSKVSQTSKNNTGNNIKKTNTNLEYYKKIDYIYNHIRAEKIKNRVKTFIKLLILFIIVGFFYFYLPNLDAESREEFFNKFLTEITTRLQPIVTDMAKEMSESIQDDINSQINNIDLNSSNSGDTEIINISENINNAKMQELLKRYNELK